MGLSNWSMKASRRQVLAGSGIAALASFLAPRFVKADEKAVADELKKLYGDKKFAEGKIKLDIPQIAENGLVVPVNIDVESPMTDADYVTKSDDDTTNDRGASAFGEWSYQDVWVELKGLGPKEAWDKMRAQLVVYEFRESAVLELKKE